MMKRKILFILTWSFLLVLCLGLAACGVRDVVVPTPEVIGGEEDCDHDYEEEYFEATCQERAHYVYTCTLCGNSYTIFEGQLGEHDVATRHTSGTCISYGYTEYYCRICGTAIDRRFDEHYGEHSYRTVNRHVNGTCRVIGYTVTKECSVCGDQIRVSDTAYADHKYKKSASVAATCSSYGYDVYTCTVCGENYTEYGTSYLEHDWASEVVPGVDCLHSGSVHRVCRNCGEETVENTSTVGPHSYRLNGDEKHICIVCGDEKSHTHVFRDTSDLSHRTFCDVCGYVYEAETGEHTYGSPVVVEATCTQNGSVTQTCTVCGHMYKYVLPAHHTLVLSDESAAVAPACAEEGYSAYSCTVCHERVVERRSSAPGLAMGVVPAVRLSDEVDASALIEDGKISLGSYPQSLVTDPGTVARLNVQRGTLPTPQNRGSWRIYSYCEDDPYAWYIDVEEGGRKYRGVFFTAYRPTVATSNAIAKNSYVDDNGFSTGNVYWFSFEDVVWEVLSQENGCLLVASDVLDAQIYHSTFVTWEYSYLRNYLNTFFLNVCFSAREQAMLAGGDKVFLLTASDVENADYGYLPGTEYSAKRLKKASSYAAAQGAYRQGVSGLNGYGVWWLSGATSSPVPLSSLGYGASPAIGHDFSVFSSSNIISAATCRSYAVYRLSCSVCGTLSQETYEDVTGGFVAHVYAYTHTADKHTYACTVCGDVVAEGGHGYAYSDDLNGYSHSYVCTVCGYSAQGTHSYIGSNCQYCPAHEVAAYDLKWDVSAAGDNSVIAYLNMTSGVMTVMGKGPMKDYSSQELPAYQTYASRVTSVVFAETSRITSVGAYAFYVFPELRSVSIPSSVQRMGEYAFANAEKLQTLTFNAQSCSDFTESNNVFRNAGKSAALSLTVGTAVTRIPEYFLCPALDALPRVTTLSVLSERIASVGKYAFYGQSETVYVGTIDLSSARSVGEYAFYNGTPNAVLWGENLNTVGQYAFYNCQNTLFTGDLSLSSVGRYSFYGCSGLYLVRLTDVTSVPAYAFAGSGLRDVDLPDGLQTVEDYAFYNCTETLDLRFPSSLTSVGRYAFYRCNFTSLVHDGLVSVGERAFCGAGRCVEIDLPQLTSAGAYAFSDCRTLKRFSAEKLTAVSEGVFADDVALREAVLSDKLTVFGSRAFYSCYSLNRISLPRTLTEVRTNAFTGCYTLVEIENGSRLSLTPGSISNGGIAMYAKRIYASGGTSAVSVVSDIVYLTLDETAYVIGYDGYARTLTLKVDEIAPYAFYRSSLEDVTIDAKKIDKYAFAQSSNLSVATIGRNSVDGFDLVIEDNAFADCAGLVSVTIGPAVTSLSSLAFRNDCLSNLIVDSAAVCATVGEDFFEDFIVENVRLKNTASASATDYDGASDGDDYLLTYVGGQRVAGTVGSVSYVITLGESSRRLRLTGTGTVQSSDVWADYASSVTDLVVSFGISGIGEGAFAGFDALRSVMLPGGLTTLSARAFAGCENLTKIDLSGTSITSIGAHAFDGCLSLSSVTFPSGLTSVGEGAFASCKSLTSLSLPGGLTTIADGAFSDCAGLVSVSGGLGLTAVGVNAFRGCRSLVSIVLPASLTSLGEYAYADCYGVETIRLDATALADVAVNNGIFLSCGRDSAEGVCLYVGKNVTRIPANLFSPVSALSSVAPRITAMVDEWTSPAAKHLSIGQNAFKNVRTLSVFDLRAFLSIGQNALEGTRPETVYLPDLTNPLSYWFGGSSEAVPETLQTVYVDVCLTVPQGAFLDCSHLETVAIANLSPDSGCSIGDRAFKNCTSLSSVSFGDVDFTRIGKEAFRNCRLIETLSFANSGGSYTVGEFAFAGCTALGTVVLNDVGTIERSAFASSIAISSFTLTGARVYLDDASEGEEHSFGIYVISDDHAVFQSYVGNATTYTVLDAVSEKNVTEIASYAFADMNGLQTVSIGAKVREIYAYAFSDCDGLRRLSFADRSVLDEIGESAFYGCDRLSDITLPSSVRTIGEQAFARCDAFSVFALPASATSIGVGAFAECTHLERFVFATTSAITVIPERMFSDCYNLKDVVVGASSTSGALPATVRNIGVRAFEQCSSLRPMTLPDTMQRIGEYAFSHCKKFTSLTLESIDEIGNNAFYGCSGLQTLIVRRTGSFALGVFGGCENLRELTIPYIGSMQSTTETFGYIFGSSSIGAAYDAVKQGSVTYRIPSSLRKVTVLGGSIHPNSFENCISLTEVDLSSTIVTTIGRQAFAGCKKLSSIHLPSTLTTLESEAFAYCLDLTNLVLPGNVTTLEKSAFMNAGFYNNQNNWYGNVLYIKVDRDGGVYFAMDSTSATGDCVLRNNTIGILSYAFENSQFLSLTIPETVESVGVGILQGNTRITTLTAPFIGSRKGVSSFLSYFFGGTSYTDNASSVPASLSGVVMTGSGDVLANTFSSCSYLRTVALSGEYTSIGDNAFYQCFDLLTVTIPDGMESVGRSAFRSCTSLESIRLPNSVTSISVGAFAGCNSMISYSAPFIGNSQTISDSSFLGLVFSEDDDPRVGENGNLVPASLQTVLITGYGTTIPESAFYACSSLKTIVLTSAVTTVGSDAFRGCSSLTNLLVIGRNALRVSYSDVTGNFENLLNHQYNVYFSDEILTRTFSETEDENVFKNALNLSSPFDVDTIVYEYRSSDTNVAYFEPENVENGTTTIVAPGTATITVTISFPTETFYVELSYRLNVE